MSPHLASSQFVKCDVSFYSVCGLWAGHRGKVAGSFSIGRGPLRQMTVYLASCSPQVHEARCQQRWTQVMASLCRLWLWSCIQKTVLWEPTPTLTADCDTPQIHYLRANMIQCLTNDLVLWLTPSYSENPCTAENIKGICGVHSSLSLIIPNNSNTFSEVIRYNGSHPAPSENWPEPFHSNF